MQHNILITSAGKRVALTKYFKETLNRFYPEAKIFTTDMNPEMAPAGYVSDGCFKVKSDGCIIPCFTFEDLRRE